MPDAARKWLVKLEKWIEVAGKDEMAEPSARHLRRLLAECERLRESEWGVEYLRQKRIIANLRAQLDEHDAYYRKVVNDECAPDEIHCTCVPALRDKIDELRRLIDDDSRCA